MEREVVILLAEDDKGQAHLIQKNLRAAGVLNEIIHFIDGEQTLNFLFKKNNTFQIQADKSYVLLLDIRMPKVDGIQVLRQIKKDEQLKKIPVIIFTTTDDPDEIALCHELGCNTYITKPIDYERFVEAIQKLGYFIKLIQIPNIQNGTDQKMIYF